MNLSPCLYLWCFLNIFGRFRAIPVSFSSAIVRIYIYIPNGRTKPRSGIIPNVFLLLFWPLNNDRLKISIQSHSYNYISVKQVTIPATILTRELGEPVVTF